MTDSGDKFPSSLTLRSYLDHRRQHPEQSVELNNTASIEWVLQNEEFLKQHQIEPFMVLGAIEGDLYDIGQLSFRLLELLNERDDLLRSGETQVQSRGVAISDALVNYLAATMLDALVGIDGVYIPNDLIFLTKFLLIGDQPSENRALEAYLSRRDAIWLAAQIRNSGRECSIRLLAKALKVSPSTVSRWFPDGEFEEEVAQARAILNSEPIKEAIAKSNAVTPD